MTSLGIRLFWMTFISLGAWTLAATVMVLGVQHIPLPMSLIGFSTFVLQLGVGTWACINNPPAPKGNNDVRLPVYVARGCLAAAAIGVSVWMSSLGIPLLAGIFSVFPAIFLTAMVSVWLSQGQAVQAGAVGPLILGSQALLSIGSALFAPITNDLGHIRCLVLRCRLCLGACMAVAETPDDLGFIAAIPERGRVGIGALIWKQPN